VEDLEEQIQSLSEKQAALSKLLGGCPNDASKPATECPVLTVLEESADDVVDGNSLTG